MLTIYAESDQEEYWARQLNHNVTRDIQHSEVALKEVLNFDDETYNKLKFLAANSKCLIIIIPEFISDNWIHKFDQPNVIFFIAGCLNYSTKHAQVYFCPYFFWSTTDFYRAVPNYLEQLTSAPSKGFDVLLGRRKPHRDILFENIDHSCNIVRYFPENEGDIRQYANTEFEWPIFPPKEEVTMTAQEVTVGGIIISLSQVIPYTIYNQTHYTLVAETCADNEFSFFTEKIVKPMLAKRLFIVAAGQYYLRNLRRLGFQTFSGIVDESYDNIEDQTERTVAVSLQVDRLCGFDGNLVKSAITDIVEHNYRRIMKFNWQEDMVKNINLLLATI